MSILHDDLLRGLNSIYLQPPDKKSLIEYCLLWNTVLESHHEGEEINIFPAVENALGERVMDLERELHAN
jgi:hypothetical protein